MAARFDWAVPTILGNADEPVLDTDVATKAYVDANSGGGNSIVNGNTSVVANPTNVKISANVANNFQFGTDTYGTVLSLNPSNSPVQNIRAINQVNGVAINEGALFTFDGIFPYDGPEKLGNTAIPWSSVTAYGFESLGNITTDGFVANSSNIGIGNIVTINSNAANITTLTTTTLNANGGNINANTITANSVSTPKLFQTNTVGQFTCDETAVAANTTIVIPWANGAITSTDFNFIPVGGVPTGGVRNISTDTLVVSVTGSILWNQNSNTQATRITTIYLNDTIQVIEQDSIPTGSNYAGQSFSTVMLLAPAQYVSVTARNDSGGSANIGGTISGVISAPTNKLNITVLARKVP